MRGLVRAALAFASIISCVGVAQAVSIERSADLCAGGEIDGRHPLGANGAAIDLPFIRRPFWLKWERCVGLRGPFDGDMWPSAWGGPREVAMSWGG